MHAMQDAMLIGLRDRFAALWLSPISPRRCPRKVQTSFNQDERAKPQEKPVPQSLSYLHLLKQRTIPTFPVLNLPFLPMSISGIMYWMEMLCNAMHATVSFPRGCSVVSRFPVVYTYAQPLRQSKNKTLLLASPLQLQLAHELFRR